jgi:LPXTG-motif cell wall-anchored protein
MVVMRKLALVAAVTMLCGVGSTGAAYSYSDLAIQVQANPTTLVGGASFAGQAASVGLDCDWTATFRGEAKTGSGASFDFTFTTPEVAETTHRDVLVTCSYDDAATMSLGGLSGQTTVQEASYVVTRSAQLPAAVQTIERTIQITILPRSHASSSSSRDLPDTGGIDAAWFYGGFALLVVGSALVFVRRRNESNV